MTSLPLLKATGLCKKFGDQAILQDLHLNVDVGEFVVIRGKSGAGKSTLLHILGTLDKPNAGQVLVRGQDIGRLKGRRLNTFRNRNLGFIFQFHHLLPEFTAVENVAMPARIAGLGRSEAEKRAAQWLELAGLGHRLHHYPAELSGGEQQRVAAVRALVNEPDLILADEPTGNLDPATAKQLLDLFRAVRTQRPETTFIVVTHHADVADLATILYELKDGRLVKNGSGAGL